MGEEVVAVVRAAPAAEVDPVAWRDFARAELASGKVPRRWFVVEAMPTTPSGKIQKFRLPDLITDAVGVREVTPPRAAGAPGA